jgi:hypothetical protein
MMQPVTMSITATIMSMSKISRVVLSFVVPSASITITFSKGDTRSCVFPVFPGRPQGMSMSSPPETERPYILFCFHDIMTTQKDGW